MKIRRIALAVLALCTALSAHAQNVVFDDSFASDSLNAATYPAVTPTSTGWNVATNKNSPAPQETGGTLTINMAGTTSGFVETQALFAPAPVQLLPGTYIELTATFVPTWVVTNPSDNLVVGLFNSGGTPPASGLLNSGLSSSRNDFNTGGAKGWLGFNANIPLTGATAKMLTRPAQTGTTNVVQDVLFDGQSGSVGYASSTTLASTSAPGTTFTNGLPYTIDYKLALSADGNTLTATCSIYNGEGTSGTGSNTLIKSYSANATGGNLLTKAFDAMAIGWRADAGTSNPSNIQLSRLTVKTTGGTPWFTSQPPANLLVSVGSDLEIDASVGGLVTSLQWQKSTDGGATYVDIDPATNSSAATASILLSNVQNGDAGSYRLVAANAAGSRASSASTVAVTTSPVPPTIVKQPVSGTVLAGTPFKFSVTVNGTFPLTYQWLKSIDGVTYTPVTGAESATYNIASPSLEDEGYYEVTVSNIAGTATSTPVTLTVDQPLTIKTQPVGAALNLGDNFTLTAEAVGKPAPTYQWYLNGTALPDATSASYAITSATGANAGIYTVVASNTSGDSVTSDGAAVAVLSPTLAASSLTPLTGATGLAPDTRLTITFNQPVAVGVMGRIRIYDATNPTTPVDTIDLVADTALMKTLRAGGVASTLPLPVDTKTIGGVSNFHYYPVTVNGATATIYPHNRVLAYNKSYYVVIDPGVFTDTSGLAFGGIAGPAGWAFSTRTVGPAADATRLVVAADGTGDFNTVQGALDFIPSGNTTPRTIFIRKGQYFEQVYFNGKHSLTFLGEDRAQTMIFYPNNNTFNNASGTYHRMVVNGDHVNNVVFANLTIQNSTPKGGSQAEALILNGSAGSHAIVTNVDLVSFQDTLQINGSAYVANSHITGDVDFMWGNGPNFFENCEITAVTSNGYFTQIRNGSTGHGNVYLNCTLNGGFGVSGMYLGRIDPNPTQFPYSEVVWLNCTMGTFNGSTYSTPINPAGWLLNNTPDQSAASAPNVHFWEYNSHYSDGTPLNVASRIGASKQLTMAVDAATIANYSDPSWVLGWTPQLPPVIATQPLAQTVNSGSGFTLSVEAFGIPALTYQWQLNGAPIAGATDASYTVAAAGGPNAGTYSVVVSNGTSSVTSATVPLVVHGGPPVIALQPANTTGLLGATATLNVWALGDAPLSYQWSKDGSPIANGTNQSLRLTQLQASDGGNYTVAVTNAGGIAVSSTAMLTPVTPATTLPTTPTIPAGSFDVTAYGAVGDGVTDNTAAIQAAINAANAAGGGTIELPPAAAPYLSGPITLSSNTNFQVDGGAILQELPFGTYPRSTSAPSHFITVASGSSNVELSGSGVIEGDGAAWWAAFDGGTISNRPRMVQLTKTTNVLITGLTFRNSPNFHLAFSGANTNATIFGVTISAPGDSPNTDGMDLAGTNFLVQNCSVSVGDDNVVAKPGSVFCRNIYVADCAFGTGHGVSVGGQTNVGLDGMVVTNCTFNGTDTGLRLKADPTQGGPVQNITYSNITMTNVTYPILFYSYYNQIGSPGAKSGSSQTTPAKVNAWNTTPPNSLGTTTIPTWQNITVSNLTATGASGYSTIWGLPLANALVSGVTLDNVNISGGAGFELFDATNVQFTGSTSVGPLVTCNALAITGQPQGATVNVGDTVTFTASAAGASGIAGTAPAYQWALNGIALSDGPQADGSTVSGATTPALTITNARVTKAGAYTVTVSNNLDGYNVATSTLVPGSLPVAATSSPANLVVNPLPATLAVSNLTQVYDGTLKAPTVTTTPAGLAVSISYLNGATPLNAGTYPFTVTVADPNYSAAPLDDALVITRAHADVTLSSLHFIYDGTPKVPTVTTSPAGLPVTLTYDGNTAAPVTVAHYTVEAVVSDPNYEGQASDLLIIDKATPVITWPQPAAITYGTPLGSAQLNATTSVPGSFAYAPAAGTVLNAGANQSLSVVFTPSDPADYNAAVAANTITVNKANVLITLSDLSQPYDGQPKTVVATTDPAGLAVDITYAGNSTGPVYPGEYPVVATVDDPNYAASVQQTLSITITALVRHAPVLNGGIDGSVQVLSGESITLNGRSWISGDLLVPGTPTLRLNGMPMIAGSIDHTGSVSPSNYSVTLNGQSVLRYLVRRIDPIAMPVVHPPTAPAGTRSVTLNSSRDTTGNFATIRNLTLNGNVGDVVVPPGAYGQLIANGNSGFVFGHADATQPDVYNLQALTLNGNSRLKIAGPVLIVLANGVTLNGNVGNAGHPEWLTIAIASGGLTTNGNAKLYGFVIAPQGTVILNGNGGINGEVISDRLTINGSALLTEP
jgi:polygalacturonase